MHPQLEDAPDQLINLSAQFYFVNYPDRVWRAPIELNILKKLPSFDRALELITLTIGQDFEWTLPNVENAYLNDYEIEMEPDVQLAPYLSYRRDTNTVVFKDYHGSKQLFDQILEVRFTIVDSLGNRGKVA